VTLLRTVRLLGLLLVAISCLPMLGTEELPSSIWFFVAGGLVAGWFVGGRPWGRRTNIIFTTSLIAAFALILLMGFQTGEWLVYSIVFALLATVTRTLQHHTARQQFQLIALSFLLMVAASVTNPDLSFAIYFLFYAVLLTWALTYTHLLQRVEEGTERSGIAWKASRLVTRRFLVGSSALALVLLLSSMLIFLLFPRLGLGFFSARTRGGNTLTGFTDSLELGHFGTIQDSTRVIMRVEFRTPPEERPNMKVFKLRGMAFDTYNGKAWSRAQKGTTPLAADQDGFYGIRYVPRLPQSDFRVYQYDVYLEPLDIETKVLFAAPRPLGISHLATRFDRWRGTSKSFMRDPLENLSFTGPSMTSTSYTVRSGDFSVAPARLRRSGTYYPREIANHYLQLPDNLDSRIATLASSVTDQAKNEYDTAIALRDHLQLSYGYTLTGTGTPEDPVAEFLFVREEGHCEYFVTAMVLMLRTQGIPARPVNGFLGATYNEFGDYYTVTEARAHSWVEVYLGDYGWVTFDPTPAGEPLPESFGILETMELWVDAIKLRWYKWVVEYDLEKQLAVYSKVWNVFASQQNEVNITPSLSISEMRREMKKMGRGLLSRNSAILAAILVLLSLLPLFFRWLRGRRTRIQQSLLERLAHRLRQTLRSKGFKVTPGTTLPELARQGLRREFAATASLARISVALEEARWSSSPTVDLPTIQLLLRHIATAPKLNQK
jgi:protein-glutamine gamma-glutamyltransferase